jgi:hypothetical protein
MRTLLLGCAILVIATGIVRADDVKGADEKFEEGKKLREAGKVKEACDAFSASLALNPNAIGTILNVARCAEESGKTGTAVRLFTDAKNRAGEQQLDPQQKAAEEHLAKLVDHVPHLAIAFAEPLPSDGKIAVDDRVIDAASAGDVIVDPTTVKIVVSAPGRVTFETTVTFDPKGDHEHKAISVPKLAYPVAVTNTRRTVGKIMAGTGGAIYASGVVIALIARSRWKTATKDCTNNVCDESTTTGGHPFQDAHDAYALGNDATYISIVGLAIAGAGVALWFLSPSHENKEERRTAIVPIVTPGEAGVAAIGRF